MAKVKVIRETPKSPSIKDVTIVLSIEEARNLASLLYAGVSVSTLQQELDLDDLAESLSRQIQPFPRAFRSVAYV